MVSGIKGRESCNDFAGIVAVLVLVWIGSPGRRRVIVCNFRIRLLHLIALESLILLRTRVSGVRELFCVEPVTLIVSM